MQSWYNPFINPFIVWPFIIYIATSVIAGPIVIVYETIKLIKRSRNKKKKDDCESRLE